METINARLRTCTFLYNGARRWHTINLDLNWLGPIGLVAWAQFWSQNWPQTNFWPGFESWPGLKFGLLNNACPEHFFQTDIFSVILIGFID